jgi:hypothetical protein
VKKNNWFEGANTFSSSNNQGIEVKNKEIKPAPTFRKRMPLRAFIDCMLRMVYEWSLEDSSLLTYERSKILHTKPNGLKLRTDGYSWYRTHKKILGLAKLMQFEYHFVKLRLNETKYVFCSMQLV